MGEKFIPTRSGHLVALAAIIGGVDLLINENPEMARIVIPECEERGVTFEHMIIYPDFNAGGWIQRKQEAEQPLSQAEEDWLAEKGWS